MIAQAVYLLCALTCLGCAWLLLRGYARNRVRLLLWSGLCFAALTINNLMLFIDLVALPQVDLSVWRELTALGGVILLLYGLVWDSK